MSEPLWIDERDILALHSQLLALDGGSPGIRSKALLDSALARPRQLYAYGKRADLIAIASALICGIVRNHPFVDGNKRTGFVAGVLFLEMNGYRFSAAEEDATQAIMSLASGALAEPAFALWLRENSSKR